MDIIFDKLKNSIHKPIKVTDWMPWRELLPQIELGDAIAFRRGSMTTSGIRFYQHYALAIAYIRDDDGVIIDVLCSEMTPSRGLVERPLSEIQGNDLVRIHNVKKSTRTISEIQEYIERVKQEAKKKYNLLFSYCETWVSEVRIDRRTSLQVVDSSIVGIIGIFILALFALTK